MIKKIGTVIVTVGLLVCIAIAGMHFSDLYHYIDNYKMGEVVVNITEDQVNDYTVLDHEAFNVIGQEQLALLKKYMQDNNLKLRCGDYEVNETYTYDELLEVFEFEEATMR